MALDDDDNPALAAPPPTANTTTATPDAPAEETAEDLLEDEGAAAQDFRVFASLFKKNTHISAQTIRKGEKDFESHGTQLQADTLEQSRAAMQEVLSYTRIHSGANLVRGWYFPGWWADYEEGEEWQDSKAEDGKKERKPFGHIRDRVVILEGSSTSTQNLGRAVTGQAKDRPGRGKDWLLPEEALYLVERGSLDLWWPTKEFGEIFPPPPAAPVEGEAPQAENTDVDPSTQPTGASEDEEDEYADGFPLSLQAAYALLIGLDGTRGKISLQKFQVYSNLKRCGYNVLRAPPNPPNPNQSSYRLNITIKNFFSSLLPSFTPSPPKSGPLLKPGLYRSYNQIFSQLSLIERHIPSPVLPFPLPSIAPYEIHFLVWKSSQKWTKLRHPSPDFYLSVVDAQESEVPQMEEILGLLEQTPWAPPKREWEGNHGRLYARLKNGWRNVLMAVVDHGVINYMRWGEGGFGQERIYERFDGRNGSYRGGKRGGRNQGRGGRGGRGGGRGRGRGRGRGG
ncbi:tRNA-splicing endonuclease subunit sen54 [Podospora pseudopauciseta]|uniref:tRNA-splicing endonuclease subunit sen54 n=1 Tax=Podospora pseudopauciseta TaxID=2093780 RepID=A0ABR0HHB3_9PEZI|nr:tRNA-splicing endonuclease subunit sen54 [Podospora pseudopauciseta]